MRLPGCLGISIECSSVNGSDRQQGDDENLKHHSTILHNFQIQLNIILTDFTSNKNVINVYLVKVRFQLNWTAKSMERRASFIQQKQVR